MKYQDVNFVFHMIILCIEIHLKIVEAIIGYDIRPAGENEFPAVVGIASYLPGLPLNQRVICSGTLISVDNVLTSEHCLYHIEFHHLEIIVGSHDLRNGIVYYPIWGINFDNWATLNQRVRPCIENDIAVIKLYNVRLQIFPMPLSTIEYHNILNGHSVEIAGFGIINDNTVPLIMYTTSVVVLGSFRCNRLLSFLEERTIVVPMNYMCTSNNPFRYLAPGDSGGPLISNGTLVAVNKGISPATYELHPNKINSHISISLYLEFIYSILAEN